MHIVVIADEVTQKEFLDKQIPQGIQVYFVNTVDEVDASANALFFLKDEYELKKHAPQLDSLQMPVFINAVSTCLKDLPAGSIRINAWPGFLLNKEIEVCASPGSIKTAEKILNALHWPHLVVPDIEGMIAPRTIAMIINEAYFALGEDVSTKVQINIAMKLGTNYPHGPFEWADKIGLSKIYRLLQRLSQTDECYMPAPLLQSELNI